MRGQALEVGTAEEAAHEGGGPVPGPEAEVGLGLLPGLLLVEKVPRELAVEEAGQGEGLFPHLRVLRGEEGP